MKGRIVTLWALTCVTMVLGCRTDAVGRRSPVGGAPLTAMESVEIARQSETSLARAGEVDLVEQLIEYRTRYSRSLKQLGSYYRQHGYAEKLLWTQSELEDVGRIRAYHYLYSSDIPRLSLEARVQDAEADALYEKAMALATQAGHGTPVFYNQEKMGEALALFKQLIEQYPTCDKIDDAAFHCGEILKEYFKNQDSVAVQWYERAWTWDAATPHPARFQAAVVCDYRLHDRKRALELYRAAIAAEPSRSNKHFALARIKELTETGPVDGQRTTPIAQPSPTIPPTAIQKKPATPTGPVQSPKSTNGN